MSMEDEGPFDRHAPLQEIIPATRDASLVARLLARRPPYCPFVRCALEHILRQTLAAWSRDDRGRVRPAASMRRTIEPALQAARVFQPRKGEAR
jgi:hypothetical protein